MDGNEAKEMGRLVAEVESLRRDVEDLRASMKELTEMAHRWRGAVVILLGFGSFAGWLISLIPKFK